MVYPDWEWRGVRDWLVLRGVVEFFMRYDNALLKPARITEHRGPQNYQRGTFK